MKNLKIILFSFAFLATTLSFYSCGEEAQGKEYTSAYICPMHCDGSGSDAPGKCPVCEMDYVQNENNKEETQNSDSSESSDGHEGHNH